MGMEEGGGFRMGNTQDPSPLRGTLGSSLRSPAEGEGHEGFPPPPDKDLECLENPRDGGAWWAAVYGVTQSRTRLKRLSSINAQLPHSSGKVTLSYDPWMGKNPWRRNWQTTPVVLPRKSHGQRSLVGYSPWGRKSQT